MDIQKLLKQNLGLKILSIVISIALWASLKYTSPASLYNYYQTSLYVPVKYVNAPEGLVPVHTDEQVLIELKGDPAKIASISSSNSSFGRTVNAFRSSSKHSPGKSLCLIISFNIFIGLN